MARAPDVTVTVHLRNQDEVQRLAEAAEKVLDVAGDMPWRPELKEAAETLRDLCENGLIAEAE